MRTVAEWKDALRAAIKDAMRRRDTGGAAVFRTALAALDNAEAPAVTASPSVKSGALAGALVGLGAGEVPRLHLSPETAASLVEREMRERLEAAAAFEAAGRTDDAQTSRRQAELLERLLRA